jgi:hypothetical protein
MIPSKIVVPNEIGIPSISNKPPNGTPKKLGFSVRAFLTHQCDFNFLNKPVPESILCLGLTRINGEFFSRF